MDPTGTPVASLLLAAKQKGYGTGVVCRTRVTDATPAAFTAHALSRKYEQLIAAQQVTRNILPI